MTELGDSGSAPGINYLLELVRPQCRDCVRPRLLGDEILANDGAHDDLDWQKVRVVFVGYIALCPREEVPGGSDGESCTSMMADRRCRFDELVQMGKAEMSTQAEALVARSRL